MKLMKSVVSLMYDLWILAIGWMGLSTNADILSIGPSHPEMIGRPTGLGLWIFVSVGKNQPTAVPSLESIQKQMLNMQQMLLNFQNAIDNKSSEKYQNFLNADTNQDTHVTHEQPKSKSKSRKVRRKIQKLKRNNNLRQQNERYIQNMSNEKLSNEEISLLSQGLKFVPTPNSNEKIIRHQLMQDFNEFERRMRSIDFNLYLQTTRKNRIPSMSLVAQEGHSCFRHFFNSLLYFIHFLCL